MGEAADTAIDTRIAERLRALRQARGWSLEALAARSGVSRGTLSRLENAEVSATAAVLGRLCAAHGITLSRLVHMLEGGFPAHVPRDAQPEWTDPATGFHRRAVSPPGPGLSGEAIEGRLPPRARIDYPEPPRPGLEHHLVVLDGALTVTVGGASHALAPGDALRYRLEGPSAFETAARPARYLLFTV